MITQERARKIMDTFYNKSKNAPEYFIYNLRKEMEHLFKGALRLDDIYDSFINKAYVSCNLVNFDEMDSNQIIINKIKEDYTLFLVDKYSNEVKILIKKLINEKEIELFNEVDDNLIDQKSTEDICLEKLGDLWSIKVKHYKKYLILFNCLKFKGLAHLLSTS
jgi:hypothetical protein